MMKQINSILLQNTSLPKVIIDIITNYCKYYLWEHPSASTFPHYNHWRTFDQFLDMSRSSEMVFSRWRYNNGFASDSLFLEEKTISSPFYSIYKIDISHKPYWFTRFLPFSEQYKKVEEWLIERGLLID